MNTAPDAPVVGRAAPPFAFMLLHASLAWPASVVSLALGNGLVRAGVPVHQAAQVIATTSLAFTLEFPLAQANGL